MCISLLLAAKGATVIGGILFAGSVLCGVKIGAFNFNPVNFGGAIQDNERAVWVVLFGGLLLAIIGLVAVFFSPASAAVCLMAAAL